MRRPQEPVQPESLSELAPSLLAATLRRPALPQRVPPHDDGVDPPTPRRVWLQVLALVWAERQLFRDDDV